MMQSYRKRVAIQIQHKTDSKPVKQSKKYYPDVKVYLLKAIRMYQKASKRLAPLSDEWVICQNELFRHKNDFELLENGTHEERKEVIRKYGG